MKTSNYFALAPDHSGGISISRWQPRKPIKYAFPVYKELRPGSWFKSVDEAEYRRLYGEILSELDPQQVWDDLHELAGNHEPVLLCWERPGQFCHRRLVAVWLEDELGISVPEEGSSQTGEQISIPGLALIHNSSCFDP